MYSFPYLEPVCCSMSISNCCFFTRIQISQEAGQVVWYSHLFKNFSRFAVIHTVKGFSVVNKAEVDVFLELSCFFYDPMDVGNLISGSSAFSKSSLNIWKFTVHVLLKLGLENFEHYFASNCAVVWSQPRNWTRAPALQVDSLSTELSGKPGSPLGWCKPAGLGLGKETAIPFVQRKRSPLLQTG